MKESQSSPEIICCIVVLTIWIFSRCLIFWFKPIVSCSIFWNNFEHFCSSFLVTALQIVEDNHQVYLQSFLFRLNTSSASIHSLQDFLALYHFGCCPLDNLSIFFLKNPQPGNNILDVICPRQNETVILSDFVMQYGIAYTIFGAASEYVFKFSYWSTKILKSFLSILLPSVIDSIL